MSDLREGAEGVTPPRSLYRRIEGPVVAVVRIFVVALLVGIVFAISWQVLTRYVPGLPVPRWTEEVSLILMVWLAMVGSALAVRSGEHLAMDVLHRQVPLAWRVHLVRFVWLIAAAFSAYLVWYGWELTTRTMVQTFSATKLPVGWMYLGIPVGGVLMLVFSIRNILVPPVTTFEDEEESVAKPNRLIQGVFGLILLVVVAGLVALFGLQAMLGPIGILLGTFGLTLLLGVPIAFGLGIAGLVTILVLGVPPLIVAQRMANGVNSTPLLAIPFFIMAGQLMAEGGIAARLVDFARVLVGPIRGGLAMVNVVASMLFGGASGSAVGDVSANGSILIPMMKRKGYDTDFSVAITVASSTQGIIIPPSHNAVIYSLAAGGVSIGALFLGGYIPGIMIGLGLMVASYILAIRRGYPSEPRPPVRASLRISLEAIPALAVGFIIVGGIAFGFFTATEAAAIGTIAAFLVGAFIYRELTPRKLWEALLQSVRTISIVIFLIATASAFAWLMAYLRIPTAMADGMLSLTHNPIVLLLIINVMLLMLGAIMDMAPLILILTPVLLPIVMAPPISMSPVHFGIVLLMNLGVGLTTPPVGTALFVGCAIGNIRIERASRAMLFLWPAMIVVLMLVTYVPWFVNFLPNLFHMRS